MDESNKTIISSQLKILNEIEKVVDNFILEIKKLIELYKISPDLVSDKNKSYLLEKIDKNDKMMLFANDNSMNQIYKDNKQNITNNMGFLIILINDHEKMKKDNTEDESISLNPKLKIGLKVLWFFGNAVIAWGLLLVPILGPFLYAVALLVGLPIQFGIVISVIKDIIKSFPSKKKRKRIPGKIAKTSLLMKNISMKNEKLEKLEEKGIKNPLKSKEKAKEIVKKESMKIDMEYPELRGDVSQKEALNYVNNAKRYAAKKYPKEDIDFVKKKFEKMKIKTEIDEEKLKDD